MKRYTGDPEAGPFRIEVIADSSGKWCGNECRFDSYQEALDYGLDLAQRWTAVRDVRVRHANEPEEAR